MITLDNISKIFNDQPLFSKLNLTFEAGKIYAISGSGKTAVLNILAKLESYQDGRVIYHDKNLWDVKITHFFERKLGYLFRNFGLLENQTIQENLELGLLGQPLDETEKQIAQNAALKQVGLSHLTLNQKAYELSDADLQRVALAKIILKNPPLILADEPTAKLDPVDSKDIMEILVGLKRTDRLIVIATNSPMVWQMADEVITLKDVVG